MAGAQYRLVVRQGPNTGQTYELAKNDLSIGRDITNDIVINDAEVSRRHARLTLEGDRYKIEDLNSTNGTYIDGQRLIGPHVLATGEIIMFGDNVGVVFEGELAMTDETAPSQADLGATPVAAIPIPPENSNQPMEAPLPRPSNAPRAQTNSLVRPQPSMPVIAQEPMEEPAGKPVNSWLLAGCGCVLVIVVLAIAVWIFIDQPWNPGGGLYCVSPFDIVFKALGYCP